MIKMSWESFIIDTMKGGRFCASVWSIMELMNSSRQLIAGCCRRNRRKMS